MNQESQIGATPQIVGNISLAEFQPIERVGQDWADAVVAAIAEMENGRGVTISTAGLRRVSIYHAIRSRCAKLGFAVSFRFDGDTCHIIRKQLYLPRQQRLRDEQITNSYLDGEALRDVAAKFGLSYQRVHQIVDRFCKVSPKDRPALLNKFIEPFLEAVGDEPCCILCGGKGRRMRGVCKSCGDIIETRTRIASWLRSYRSGGKRHHLLNAKCQIAKHNIRPEDLRGH